ncbi:hypothetical protein ACTXT7_015742 [Hymenolepis weldensis]
MESFGNIFKKVGKQFNWNTNTTSIIFGNFSVLVKFSNLVMATTSSTWMIVLCSISEQFKPKENIIILISSIDNKNWLAFKRLRYETVKLKRTEHK